jgi:hypothetical protein
MEISTTTSTDEWQQIVPFLRAFTAVFAVSQFTKGWFGLVRAQPPMSLLQLQQWLMNASLNQQKPVLIQISAIDPPQIWGQLKFEVYDSVLTIGLRGKWRDGLDRLFGVYLALWFGAVLFRTQISSDGDRFKFFLLAKDGTAEKAQDLLGPPTQTKDRFLVEGSWSHLWFWLNKVVQEVPPPTAIVVNDVEYPNGLVYPDVLVRHIQRRIVELKTYNHMTPLNQEEHIELHPPAPSSIYPQVYTSVSVPAPAPIPSQDDTVAPSVSPPLLDALVNWLLVPDEPEVERPATQLIVPPRSISPPATATKPPLPAVIPTQVETPTQPPTTNQTAPPPPILSEEPPPPSSPPTTSLTSPPPLILVNKTPSTSPTHLSSPILTAEPPRTSPTYLSSPVITSEPPPSTTPTNLSSPIITAEPPPPLTPVVTSQPLSITIPTIPHLPDMVPPRPPRLYPLVDPRKQWPDVDPVDLQTPQPLIAAALARWKRKGGKKPLWSCQDSGPLDKKYRGYGNRLYCMRRGYGTQMSH